LYERLREPQRGFAMPFFLLRMPWLIAVTLVWSQTALAVATTSPTFASVAAFGRLATTLRSAPGPATAAQAPRS
jgi:hypothetical protein